MRTYASFCRIALALFVALAAITTLTIPAAAQQETPKADVAVTYQWLSPGVGNFLGTKIKGSNGWATEATWNLNRWFGLEGDFSANYGDVYDYSSYMFGPRIAYRHWEHLMPFAHAEVGAARLSPQGFKSDTAFAGAVGGGLDANLNQYFGLRIAEIDWVASSHTINTGLPSFDINGFRFRTGFVFLIGTKAKGPAPSATCSVNPTEVLPGEPITATVSPANFRKNATLSYEWSSNGGKTGNNAESTQIDTTGLAPGSYTAKAHVTHGKEFADCSTNFTVKQPQPPQVSCAANPTTVKTGEPSTITCTCTSPDNRAVTLSHTAASGALSATTGTTVNLDTANVTGSAAVNTVCKDDRGLTANTSTNVTVEAPPPPPQAPASLALRSVYFATAEPTVKNPNAGLVKSQQQTLISIANDFNNYLKQNPQAKLSLEAHADPRGSDDYNQKLTERRAAAVSHFLQQQGVPEANIEEHAVGKQHQMTPDEVKQSMEDDPTLTPGEKKRLQRNMKTIILAANRRVDITLTGPNVEVQKSARTYPFSAADALSLIGGREKPKAAPAPRKKGKKTTTTTTTTTKKKKSAKKK
jgi:outer membrane protein OmpA-like peptidoglycan-associated protein